MRSSFLLAALMTSLAWAQAPALTVDKVKHAFGRIAPTQPVSATFKVTNTGDAILHISGISTSCGCTTAGLTQGALQPGESSEIEATLNPAGMKGAIERSLLVASNDPAHPSLTLLLEAEVVPEIIASKDHLLFGNMLRGTPFTERVIYRSERGESVRILEAKALDAPFLILNLKQEGKEAVLEVTFDGTRVPPGKLQGSEKVVLSADHPRMQSMTLFILWSLAQGLVPAPAAVTWIEAPEKELRTRVVVSQAERRPFRILSAKATNPLIRVEGIGGAAAARHEVMVIMGPAPRPGQFSEMVTLLTDDPGQPELSIPVLRGTEVVPVLL